MSPERKKPKISIITVVYNGEEHIEECIRSVLDQTYDNIEYIIIDGGSTDGTLAIAARYTDRIDKIVSEPDEGIYDAMNKGIGHATGDIVGFIHSDDYYSTPRAIEMIADRFISTLADCVYAEMEYIRRTAGQKKVIRYWKALPFRTGIMKTGWFPATPTFFARRRHYINYGGFNTELNISADFELILRFCDIIGLRAAFVPKVIIHMRYGGESNRNIGNIWEGVKQCRRAFLMNDIYISPLFLIKSVYFRFTQLFVRSHS
ncbi:MAG: glycosyltransferase family 2 protein [Candidatus Kapaibacterium sp.]